MNRASLLLRLFPLLLLTACGGGVEPEPTASIESAPTARALALKPAPVVVAYCPSGASWDAALGFCADANNAYGPFTQAMTTACINSGAGSACTATTAYNVGPATLFLPRWSRGLARSLRGNGACPAGAVVDNALDGKCVETVGSTRNVYSVYFNDVISRCVALGGGNACYSTRWGASFYWKASFAHRLQNNLLAAWKGSGLPTVSVAVSTADQGEVYATVGSYAGNTVDPRTAQYRWASFTKHWTAVLLLKMQEAGRIDIDRPLNQYLTVPGLAYQSNMTVRMLMNHSAGVGNYLDLSPSFLNSTNSWRFYSDNDIVGYINEVGPSIYPGNAYSYSNGGYYILGMLIQKVLGVPIERAYRDWLIVPMNLNYSVLDVSSSPTNRLPGLVESSRAYAYSTTSVRADGALAASPGDAVKFLRAVHKNGFLTASSLADLRGPSVRNSNYGLGTIRFTDNATGVRYFGHTGTLLNYKNLAYYVPAYDAAVALTMNDYPSGSELDRIENAVFASVQQQYR
ncbi:MAG: serine hydrolase [Inhella sp.]|jgi:CubicO group peptidase (beta-lactamase class C family)|uniref:serine hydrolase domain-containing protein n=1 Tax=Inhella sp. TaxID=1921806 RepID=UPI0022BD70E9|nr:serine hydrolase domain-containing protein [Inhella sp.]MCZ8236053.1 serine hydrolase [Inhella sp.]